MLKIISRFFGRKTISIFLACLLYIDGEAVNGATTVFDGLTWEFIEMQTSTTGSFPSLSGQTFTITSGTVPDFVTDNSFTRTVFTNAPFGGTDGWGFDTDSGETGITLNFGIAVDEALLYIGHDDQDPPAGILFGAVANITVDGGSASLVQVDSYNGTSLSGDRISDDGGGPTGHGGIIVRVRRADLQPFTSIEWDHEDNNPSVIDGAAFGVALVVPEPSSAVLVFATMSFFSFFRRR